MRVLRKRVPPAKRGRALSAIYLLVFLSCLFFTSLCSAQAKPAPESVSIARVFVHTPKLGGAEQFERAMKKHLASRSSRADTWKWLTWEITNGPDSGKYVVGTLGHSWKDFDQHDNQDVADRREFEANVAPTLVSTTNSFYVLRTDLSLSPEPQTQPKYLQLNVFAVKPEGARLFSQTIKKMNEALRKTNFSSESFLSPNSAGGHSRWYFMTNGGEGPEYVLVTERNSYQDFDPAEKSLDDVMEATYGKEEGDRLMVGIRGTFHHVKSELLRFRPDLSFPSPSK